MLLARQLQLHLTGLNGSKAKQGGVRSIHVFGMSGVAVIHATMPGSWLAACGQQQHRYACCCSWWRPLRDVLSASASKLPYLVGASSGPGLSCMWNWIPHP
jgi:hypothetical protein